MEHLTLWSERMQGAKLLLCKLQDWRIPLVAGCKDAKVYSDAIYEALKDSLNMERFLCGGEIHYCDHKTNSKGKLIAVKAIIK